MAPKKKKAPEGETAPRSAGPLLVDAAPDVVAQGAPDATTRRGFLARSGKILTGVCVVSGVAMGLRLAIPEVAEGRPTRFALGRLVDFKVNTVTWIRERDVFVVRSDRGLGVLSARCTHLGCTVRRTADGFVCPCHGAKYGAAGDVLAGPARRPLPWYDTWLEPGGQLWVDLARPAATDGPLPIAIPGEQA